MYHNIIKSITRQSKIAYKNMWAGSPLLRSSGPLLEN